MFYPRAAHVEPHLKSRGGPGMSHFLMTFHTGQIKDVYNLDVRFFIASLSYKSIII